MRGRKKAERRAIARSFVAKAVYNMPTTRYLIDRLACDDKLLRICGWERRNQIPSESTFSRAFAEFALTQLPTRVHASVIENNLSDEIIGHISRDSTEIEAREKPVKKKSPKLNPAPRRKEVVLRKAKSVQKPCLD